MIKAFEANISKGFSHGISYIENEITEAIKTMNL